MSWKNRVVWSEGMFLRPQHFQQHDRYLEAQIDARGRSLRPCAWGFTELVLDRNLLSLGKLAIVRAVGILPDGTAFNVPDDDPAPEPLDIGDNWRDCRVVLALPLQRAGVRDTVRDEEPLEGARYRSFVHDVRDNNAGFDSRAPVELGARVLRLVPEKDGIGEFASLGLAQIVEKRADKQVVLDESFIVPCLDVAAAAPLSSFRTELLGLLHQRGEALAGRVVASGRGGASEIADFLLLQLVNRCEPLVAHLGRISPLHPEDLYRQLLMLAGEFSTFSAGERRPGEFPAYDHDNLRTSFEPVMSALRSALSMVLETTAIPIPLLERAYGIRVASLSDKSLLDSASFVLAVRADVPSETLRGRFPLQIKIGSVEHIRDLVNLQLPGINLSALPVAPRQIPYHAGWSYFELDRGSEHWKQLATSGGFAFHIAGQFPGLEMAFWAIRG